ncbi:MAG: nucleotidyltransferase family protein [Saprospiraceae bacterium]|nr:nucleotidyltransferase family protein [Saprospiraceae bacterium]
MGDFFLTSIVLAAGLSRRMGEENKLLLPFGKSTLLETTLSNIVASQLGEICVVVGHEAKEITSILMLNTKYPRFFKIRANNNYEKGMTTSIQIGVEGADEDSRGYMICLSDMPFISPSEYQFLRDTFFSILKQDKQAIVQPVFEGRRGNPTIFSTYYKKDILNLTYTEGCKPIVQNHKQHLYLVEMPTDSVVKDIDFRQEYECLRI